MKCTVAAGDKSRVANIAHRVKPSFIIDTRLSSRVVYFHTNKVACSVLIKIHVKLFGNFNTFNY